MTLKPGLNFGVVAQDWPTEPPAAPSDWLQRFARDGFVTIRIPGHSPAPHFVRASAEQCANACGQILDAGLQPLITIRDADQCSHLQHGTLVEYWNEPDITSNGWHDSRDIPEMWRVIDMCHERAVKLYISGVAGVHSRGFGFLRRLPWARIPLNVGVSIHRYSSGDDWRNVTRWDGGWFSRPPQPWQTRDDEMRHLVGLVGTRPLAITEMGYCSAQWSSDQQCEALRYEREFWDRYAEVLCPYTFADDIRMLSSCEGSYGLYDVDGTLKPHGRAFVA